MNQCLLRTDIPPQIDLDALTKRMHATSDTYTYLRASELIEEALPILKPSYLIRRFSVEEITTRGIVVGGQEFRSRIVSKKMEGQPWAWLFIATSGREMADFIDQVNDPLDKYILDEIASFAAIFARKVMLKDIETECGIAHHIILSPGSITDWSVEDVKKFFVLMDGDYQKLNVEVLDSGLINPLKSVSGLLYPTEEKFLECSICDMEDCPNRKAPFDEKKYDETMNNL